MSTSHDSNNRSPEEVEIDRIIKETNQKIETINNSIKNVPSDKPLSYDLNPPGAFQSRPFGNKAAHEKAYQQQLDQVRTDARDKMQAVIKDKPLDTQLSAYKKIHEWAYPGKGEGEAQKAHIKSEKDIAESQDVAMKLRADISPGEPGGIPPPGKETQPEPPSPPAPRFSASLNYGRMKDKEDHTPEKSDKDHDIEIERE